MFFDLPNVFSNLFSSMKTTYGLTADSLPLWRLEQFMHHARSMNAAISHTKTDRPTGFHRWIQTFLLMNSWKLSSATGALYMWMWLMQLVIIWVAFCCFLRLLQYQVQSAAFRPILPEFLAL